MDDKTITALQLIVEKANKLRRFNFEQHDKDTGFRFSIDFEEGERYTITFDLPEEKERDAFILTFRLFFQDNELISFPKINSLSQDPDLSTSWKESMSNIRSNYFGYINGHSRQTVELFEGQPSREEMLRIGLYGGLAHANDPGKIQQYEEWANDNIKASVFEQEFSRILVTILGFIYQLSAITIEELERHHKLAS